MALNVSRKFFSSVRTICVPQCRAMSRYYPIDENIFGLNEEQIQFRETVFNFVQKELAPKANEIDKNNTFDDIREFWRKMGSLGLLGSKGKCIVR